MLARLQQLTTLALLFAALEWAVNWLRSGRPVVAAAGAVLFIFGYALVLGLEFIMLYRVSRRGIAPRASGVQLVRAWFGEVLTTLRVFFWRQPFRSRAQADWLPSEATGRRGMVLVHGFACNRGFWNPWMQRLRALGVPHIAINLEPVFGSLDAYPPIIDHAVQRLRAASGQPPLVVAHSMGGLAVRAWSATAAEGAHHIVTIASPHGGTWLARHAIGRNAAEMRLDSHWLRRLAAREAHSGTFDATRWTCFYSNCDNIVFPTSTAILPGADNRHIAGSAHVRLAFVPQVFAEVLRRLDEPER
jgi:pimeloyl-ACP methyl ester carboxylesterase